MKPFIFVECFISGERELFVLNISNKQVADELEPSIDLENFKDDFINFLNDERVIPFIPVTLALGNKETLLKLKDESKVVSKFLINEFLQFQVSDELQSGDLITYLPIKKEGAKK